MLNLEEKLEITSLVGTLSIDGAHLHMSVADKEPLTLWSSFHMLVDVHPFH